MASAQAIEALKLKVDVGCDEDRTNRCIDEFWALYLAAERARNKVPTLEIRNTLKNRIDSVMNKHGHNYAEAYEFEFIE